MRYIDSWLTGLGLEYIIPKLQANGITTPKKLALLTLRDMYEVGKLRLSAIYVIFILRLLFFSRRRRCRRQKKTIFPHSTLEHGKFVVFWIFELFIGMCWLLDPY